MQIRQEANYKLQILFVVVGADHIKISLYNAGAGAALVQRHEDFNLGESHSGDQGFPVSSPPPSLLLGPSRLRRKNSHLRQIGPFRVW